MRRKFALLAIVAAGLAAPAAAVPVASAAPVVVVKTCGAGYVHAYLP